MVSGCETFEDARLKAEEMAWHSGWTNPRWWQWWRWGDRKVYLVEPKIKYQPKSDVLQPSQLEPTNK